MATIKEMIRQANADGYVDDNAEAKVCQDVVLKAISESTLSRNVTIKGGVVMRSIEDFHLSTLRLKYEEALAEYEKCRCTGLGRLVANREEPVLKRAKELLAGTNANL